MSGRRDDSPASDHATLDVDGGTSWLVFTRDLPHPPEKVWRALTEPAHLREWAPFDASGRLDRLGAVDLTWVDAPAPVAARITRVEAPTSLEIVSDGKILQWRLDEREGGTRLTLRAVIDRRFIAMGAAGWHLALDVLRRALDGSPGERIAGRSSLGRDDWQRLHTDYARRFEEAP